ncbi:hypothetical protein [Neobacillus piezotolerans]|uniref:hypothetical protein n=1 Tax=Neobacillus piezotolerans TaxID=2259171 RepID=UPI0015F18C46|nr:hypothetical protein [Neobacillus piezotolerans]
MAERIVLLLVLIIIILATTAQIIYGELSATRGLAAAGAILLIAYLWLRPKRRG